VRIVVPFPHDLPTVSGSGLPGYEAVGWFGLLAPAGQGLSQAVSAAKKTKARMERAPFDGSEHLDF
jgi:hypothetical protein